MGTVEPTIAEQLTAAQNHITRLLAEVEAAKETAAKWKRQSEAWAADASAEYNKRVALEGAGRQRVLDQLNADIVDAEASRERAKKAATEAWDVTNKMQRAYGEFAERIERISEGIE